MAARVEQAIGCGDRAIGADGVPSRTNRLFHESNPMITLNLPDGSTKQFDGDSVPVAEAIESLGGRWLKEAVAAEFDGRIVGLQESISGEGAFKVLRESDPDSLDVLRHSASHLLAHAVMDLYPEAKFAIGPPIQDGFYYDFDVEKPFTPDVLVKIEAAMRKLIKTPMSLEREVWPKQKALDYFKNKNETYKVEMIEELPDDDISIYQMGGFLDLCAGPHLDSSRGLLAWRFQPADAAAHLRHRLLQEKGPGRAPAAPGRSREARPPQTGQAAGPVRCQGGGRWGTGVLASQGRCYQGKSGGLSEGAVSPEGLRARVHSAHRPGRAVADLWPFRLL